MGITMYDDVRVDLIPPDARAVAGYVNGKWPTYPTLLRKFPHALKLSIAVSSLADADCLDVEPHDATNAVAAAWVKRQQVLGTKRPCLYTSVSNAQPLLDAIARSGVKRSDVRLWTAHYNERPHLCDSRCWPGFKSTADATQWSSHALGRSLDISLCRDDFFFAPQPPSIPVPKPRSPQQIKRWKIHLRLARAVRRLVGPDSALDSYIAKLKRLIR